MVIAGPVRSSLSLKERGLLMRYLPDGEQMKKADQYTIQQIGVPSVVLMERAALKIVEVLEEKKKDLRRPLIVCGSGNNGCAFYGKRKLYDGRMQIAGSDRQKSRD